MTDELEIEWVHHPKATLVQSNASDEMVAMAAWVSQDRDNEERLKNVKQVEGLIRFLMREKHMSPFEHGQFTFKIDVPLFVRSEWHRHRTQSYNEVSGRYTEMKPRIYIPIPERPAVQKGKVGAYNFEQDEELILEVIEDHKEVAKFAFQRYFKEKRKGVANELARNQLPLNLMTQFYATMNPRNLMQFLDLRTDPQALYEIREVANQCLEIFKKQMPLTYGAYVSE